MSMPRPTLKTYLACVALFAFAMGTTMVISHTHADGHAAPPAPPPLNAFPHAIGAEGLVEPKSENILIAPAVPGLVTAVRVKALQHVRAGDVLWLEDRRDLDAQLPVREADVGAAKAAVAEADASLADAEVQLSLIERVTDKRAIREEDLERRRISVDAANAQVLASHAALARAQASLRELRTDLERLVVTAPVEGQILKVDVRPGEYAVVPANSPLIIMGDTTQLNVRADVAEEDIPRFDAHAKAYGAPRGNATRHIPLEFVRVEPHVIPKVSLTGDTTERVDTRVMQVIYKIADSHAIYDGEQMDVYIEAPLAADVGRVAGPAGKG